MAVVFSLHLCTFVQYTGGWFQPPSTSNTRRPTLSASCMAHVLFSTQRCPTPLSLAGTGAVSWTCGFSSTREVESSPRTAQPCTPAAQRLTHPTPRSMCLPTFSDAQPLLRSATDRPTRPTPSQRPGPTTNLQSTPSPPRHQPAANFPCCNLQPHRTPCPRQQ